MHINISASVMIDRPPAQVFARLTDLNQWPQWGGNLVSMEQISPGPLQVGSKIRLLNKPGRKPIESEVTQFTPDQTFGIRNSNLEGTFALEPIESGTRLNALFAVEATGLMALMYRVLLKQFVKSDLRKFKALVEASSGV